MSDPLASVRPWAVQFVLAGQAFTISPRPASDWLEAVLGGGPGDLLDDDDIERITDLAAEGRVSSAELERVFADTVGEACGREWQVGVRLVGLLMHDHIRGEVFAAIDPETRPLAAVLDVVYSLMVRFKKDEEWQEFDAMLAAPPETTPGAADPRERARQMREQSKRLLAERSAASDTPSSD